MSPIESGKKYSIGSVTYEDKYITCDDDEASVCSRGYRNGYGRRWFFNNLGNGNWTIKSTRYNVYLGLDNSGNVRVSSHADKWTLRTTSEPGVFKVYNAERYGGQRLLALHSDSSGEEISLVSESGSRKEKWEILPFN